MSVQVPERSDLAPAEANALRREAERAGSTNPLLERRLVESANAIEFRQQAQPNTPRQEAG